jgi:type IV pilus assembly protein PilW
LFVFQGEDLKTQYLSMRRQRGFSIVEIMVSLVIGMVVVAAVLFTYLGTGTAGRSQTALSQMNEDVMVAFSLLARDLQMAGYSEPNGIVATGGGGTATFGRLFTGRAVFGCETPPVDPKATPGIACSVAGGTVTHIVEINYQATPVNSVQSGGTPTDCIGNPLTISGTYYVSNNRYYVTPTVATGRPELHCTSAGRPPQPLVENVQAMKLWFGEADAADPRRAVRYVPSSVVADWGRVNSVRICLLMRSAEPVLDSDDPVSAAYTDCEGNLVTPTDRRIYRAFFSTVALRNRIGF